MPEEDLLALLSATGFSEADVIFKGRNARSNHEATAVLEYRANRAE
ncbi:MAG TPA: hypothetical protein QGF05_10585 [Dehalococcoidia bacterium]|nr:hypothetical protein [Dehalococcoidia bacterium]